MKDSILITEKHYASIATKKFIGGIDLLTAGFPCQPFSQAGKRRGKDDDRFLWPETIRIIRDSKPTWCLLENVRGILTIEGGLVFEQVCLDLEGEGYAVQPFIIPAVAVNAPHRRDRVWFVANRTSERDWQKRHILPNERTTEKNKQERKGRERGAGEIGSNATDATDTESKRMERRSRSKPPKPEGIGHNQWTSREWDKNWLEVATELCRVDDGLSDGLDFAGWSKAGHRVQRLKSLGNSIVPQVAIEIMKAIKYSDGN